jgi:hypothetical protein
MSIETIPDVCIQQILYFVNNAKDFRSCELMCKKMQRIIRCDDQWKYCGGKYIGGVLTDRARACIHENLGRIRETQRKDTTMDAIVGTLGVNGLKKLVNDIIQCCLPQRLKANHSYYLRGDTLAVMAEAVQFYMTEQLERASLISINRTRANNDYPEIRCDDYTLAETLLLGVQRRSLALSFRGFFTTAGGRHDIDDYPDTMTLPGRSTRDTVIRKLAFRAGVVKMTSTVYDFAWKSLIQLIVVLVAPACTELVEISRFESGRKRSLDTTDMRMVPPPALEQISGILLHTPVPRQIQDAASRLGIGRVYGDVWLVCEGSTEEVEIAAAEARYIVKMDEEGSAEDSESIDDESHYEDSDIDFSEYEDDVCPDMLSPTDEKDTAPDVIVV